MLLVSNIASAVLGFFYAVYVPRYLGAQGFGVLSFAVAFTGIFSVLTDIGLQVLMIREIARDRALTQKYLGNIALLKTILVTVTFGLIALAINLMDYPGESIRVVYLMALALVFNAFSVMFYSVFRAYERMEFEALAGVLSSGVLLAGAFYAISHHFGVIGFALIYVIASAIGLVYSFAISGWKFAMPRIEIDLEFCKEALKQAWPFGLIVIFSTLYYYIDSVMLSFMKGEQAVGWYNAAYRLVSFTSFIPVAYFGAVFPIMSRFHTSSKESLRFIYEKSFKYMLTLAMPIGVGTTLLASKMILLIFGAEYTNSIIALQLLIWSMGLMIVYGTFAQLFNSVNKQLIGTIVVIICAIFNVILNLILIPKYSLTGASISIVATQFLGLALSYVWSRRIGYGMSPKNTIATTVRIGVASIVMCLFILALKNFYILALIPMSALLYFAVLYIIGGIDKEDRLLLRQIIRRQSAA